MGAIIGLAGHSFGTARHTSLGVVEAPERDIIIVTVAGANDGLDDETQVCTRC